MDLEPSSSICVLQYYQAAGCRFQEARRRRLFNQEHCYRHRSRRSQQEEEDLCLTHTYLLVGTGYQGTSYMYKKSYTNHPTSWT